MKLVSLYVKSFGKLKNFRMDFDDGLNVIKQDNGFGKTTLCNFVRAMLYGFKYARSKRGGESVTDAGVWATWNSAEKIGGNLVVEQNGERYRIERYFGATAKTETLSVTSESTGKELDISQVGEYFLGLTAESFDRSAYFPQESVEISSNENFDSKLAGLVQNAENFDKVAESLKEYQSKLASSRRDHAAIPDAEKRKLQLLRQLDDCKRAEARKSQIDDRLKAIASEQVALQEESLRCGENVALLQKQLGQMQQTEQQIAAGKKLALLKEKLNRVGPDMEKDKAECDALSQKIQKTPSLAQTQRPVHKLLLVLGLVLALSGIGVCFLQLIVGICVALVGASLTVAAFFVRPALSTLPSGEREELVTQYFQIASKYVYCKQMDYDEVQKAMWEKYNEYTGDKREYEALAKTAVACVDTSEVEDRLRQQQAQAYSVQQTLVQLSAEAGRLQEERKNLNVDSVELREKLMETDEQLALAKRQYAVAEKTLELLLQAKENLSVSYLPKLRFACAELLNKVTRQNYEVVLDRNFCIQLRTQGVTKRLDYFSRGVRELTLLCFRIALSQLLFGGEIPFLLVDDAFVNFDEQNFLGATALLKELSQKSQVVYFTCHQRLGNLK